MYTEEKNGFPIKDLLLKILFLAVFVLILMWLFSFSKNNVNVKPLTDKIFAENISDMKAAAKAYYTNDKLPKEIGEKTGMTLQNMLDRKMLVSFVDSQGKSCDTRSSYVEITKISKTEYSLKAYLSCGDQADYVIETMGCYDKCCDKVVDNTPATPTNPKQPEQQSTGKTKHAVTHTEYKYIKTATKEVLSNFTEWSFTQPTVTPKMRELQDRMVYKYITGYSEHSVTEYEFMKAYSSTVSSVMGAELVCSGGVWTIAKSDICQSGNCETNNGSCPNSNDTYSNPHITSGTCGSKIGSACPINGSTSYCTNTWAATCSRIDPYNRTWNTSTSLDGWVRTSSDPRVSDHEHTRTSDWVVAIPAGYTKYTEQKQYRYRTVTDTQNVVTATTWSDYTSLSGWTKTNEQRTVTTYVYY